MTEQVNQKLFSNEYWPALEVSLVLQILIGFPSFIAIDGGMLWEVCYFAMTAYWCSFLLILFRRPNTPTKDDLTLIRWGFLPFLFFVPVLMMAIWKLRGM